MTTSKITIIKSASFAQIYFSFKQKKTHLSLDKDVAVSDKKQKKHSVARSQSTEEEMALVRKRLSFITFVVNVTLMLIKAVAIHHFEQREIKRCDPYVYPRGKTQLEPLALIIVSVVMGVAIIQMIVESIESVVRNTVEPSIPLPTIAIMVLAVLVKFILLLQPRNLRSSRIHYYDKL
uniref:Cation_ATPase_C domain-containing protein n=1 Tax=Steinernema glaseri TaxID=37863 RepID=A0A1I7YB63_9BILA